MKTDSETLVNGQPNSMDATSPKPVLFIDEPLMAPNESIVTQATEEMGLVKLPGTLVRQMSDLGVDVTAAGVTQFAIGCCAVAQDGLLELFGRLRTSAAKAPDEDLPSFAGPLGSLADKIAKVSKAMTTAQPKRAVEQEPQGARNSTLQPGSLIQITGNHVSINGPNQ